MIAADRREIQHRILNIEGFRALDPVVRAEYAALLTQLDRLADLHGGLLGVIAGIEDSGGVRP